MNMSEVNTSMCFVVKEPPLCKNNSDDFAEGIIAVFFWYVFFRKYRNIPCNEIFYRVFSFSAPAGF